MRCPGTRWRWPARAPTTPACAPSASRRWGRRSRRTPPTGLRSRPRAAGRRSSWRLRSGRWTSRGRSSTAVRLRRRPSSRPSSTCAAGDSPLSPAVGSPWVWRAGLGWRRIGSGPPGRSTRPSPRAPVRLWPRRCSSGPRWRVVPASVSRRRRGWRARRARPRGPCRPCRSNASFMDWRPRTSVSATSTSSSASPGRWVRPFPAGCGCPSRGVSAPASTSLTASWGPSAGASSRGRRPPGLRCSPEPQTCASGSPPSAWGCAWPIPRRSSGASASSPSPTRTARWSLPTGRRCSTGSDETTRPGSTASVPSRSTRPCAGRTLGSRSRRCGRATFPARRRPSSRCAVGTRSSRRCPPRSASSPCCREGWARLRTACGRPCGPTPVAARSGAAPVWPCRRGARAAGADAWGHPGSVGRRRPRR